MLRQPKTYFTAEEYLFFERGSLEKHDYFQGEIFDLAGASRAHSRVLQNLLVQMVNGLQEKRSTCHVYNQDMRLNISENGLFTYPDLMAVCGEERFLPGSELDTLLNPVFIAEVLSPSTETYDKNQKFEWYKKIPEFCEYLLLSTKEIRIEQFLKGQDGNWLLTEITAGDIQLVSLDLKIGLGKIYLGSGI